MHTLICQIAYDTICVIQHTSGVPPQAPGQLHPGVMTQLEAGDVLHANPWHKSILLCPPVRCITINTAHSRARHARWTSQVCYPKRTSKPLYRGLVAQLESLRLPILGAEDILHGEPLAQRFDVVLDAMFGFSFKGDPRPPFDTLLQACDCSWALAVCSKSASVR